MTTPIAEYLWVCIALLSASVCIVATFRWLWISPILGYFAAGMLISEYEIVPYGSGIDSFAELGVVFLLFIIGLEMSLPRIRKMKKYVLGVGSIQYVLSAILIAIGARACGCSWASSYVIGSGIATSSTAIVMGLISSSTGTLKRISDIPISVLLFQDIAVIPALVVLPILASSGENVTGFQLAQGLFRAFIKGTVALAGIFVFGHFLLRRLFRIMDELGLAELFTATALLVVLSAAYTTEYFGLSMALGAFMAGSMVAETEYVKRVETVILPFKSLLLGLFFITVGMSFDVNALISDWWIILLSAIFIVVVKAVIIFLACRIFKVGFGASIHVALLLSQGSEFAFVLFDMASYSRIMNERIANIAMSATTITMTLTPLLAALGKFIHIKLGGDNTGVVTNSINSTEIEDYIADNAVLILGLGHVGSSIVRQLSEGEVPYIAIDINLSSVDRSVAKGLKAICSDATDITLYKSPLFSSISCVLITAGNVYTAKKLLMSVLLGIEDVKVVVRVSDMTKWSYEGIDEIDRERVVLVYDKAEVAIRMANEAHVILSDDDEVRFLEKYYQADNYDKLFGNSDQDK